MKTIRLLGLLPVLLLAACSTPTSRIARHQAAFDSWPAAVREQIRAGRVALGFTPEQVRVALGGPDQVLARTTAAGEAEVWVYRELGPADTRTSVELGVGAGSAGGLVGGGVSLGGYSYEEVVRVTFERGTVSGVETRRR